MNSMTGFGAASAPLNSASLRVEISGVNRKQAEVVVNLPRAWAELEAPVRECVAAGISRGRVSVSISMQSGSAAAGAITLRRDLLEALASKLHEAAELLGREPALSADTLLRLGILAEASEADMAIGDVWTALEPALRDALAAFIAMRAREGAHLRADLLERVATLRAYRARIAEQAAGVTAHYRAALSKRLAESGLPLPLDDERLVKEIALFADRCDVSEELSRLESHLCQFEQLCSGSEPVGRTLDFLCQEIFRELNTTGSKANSAALAQLVVSAKTELEKIREQVQNVE